MTLVLGIDIGGTGSRAALGEVDDAGSAPRIIDQLTGTRIEIGSSGSTVLDVVRELVRSAAETWPDRFSEVSGIGIGATGIASLAEDPSAVLAEISAEHGVPAVVAIDAVTAHLGALGGTGGAITVLGTGAIAIAHPGPDESGNWTSAWSRADGWGHLFGDRGGGAWLGRQGLELALRTHDGTDEPPDGSDHLPRGRVSSIPAMTGPDCSPSSPSTSPVVPASVTQRRLTCSEKRGKKRPAAPSPPRAGQVARTPPQVARTAPRAIRPASPSPGESRLRATTSSRDSTPKLDTWTRTSPSSNPPADRSRGHSRSATSQDRAIWT